MQQPPEQQQFPQINANITPDGMIISVVLGPGFVFQQAIGGEMLDEICKKWKETRKKTNANLEIVRNMDVVRSINGKK